MIARRTLSPCLLEANRPCRRNYDVVCLSSKASTIIRAFAWRFRSPSSATVVAEREQVENLHDIRGLFEASFMTSKSDVRTITIPTKNSVTRSRFRSQCSGLLVPVNRSPLRRLQNPSTKRWSFLNSISLSFKSRRISLAPFANSNSNTLLPLPLQLPVLRTLVPRTLVPRTLAPRTLLVS